MSGVHRRTRSINLRRTLERLLDIVPERSLEEDGIRSPGSGSSASTLSAAIHTRLWSLTQRRLFNPLSARKLKPLDASKRTSGRGEGSKNMLEESPIDGGDDEPLFDYPHSDLLLDSQGTLLEEDFGYNGKLFKGLDITEADDSHTVFEEFPLDTGNDKLSFDSQDGELLFESQGILVEEGFGQGGKLLEELDVTDADGFDEMLDEFPMDGGDNGPLFDSQDDDLLFESQRPFTDEEFDHSGMFSDELDAKEVDDSHDMLEEFAVDEGEDEPLFDSQNSELFSDSQRTLMDEASGHGGNLPDKSNAMEAENLEDELLMDGDTLVEDHVEDKDIFWEEVDMEDILSGSQDQRETTRTWGILDEDNHELLDDGTEDILEGPVFAVYGGSFAEDQSRGFSFQDEMLEDTEMGLAC